MTELERIEPEPGQESVWDYPTPPQIEETDKHIQVKLNGATIADTRRAIRLLETGHPPTYYIPPEDVLLDTLIPRFGTTTEWMGEANYYSVWVEEAQVHTAAWTYRLTNPGYEAIRHYFAFYPQELECYVDGERARAQTGNFYGGWITDDVVGPFKGE